MRTRVDEPDALAGLRDEVEQLRDLFQRRLLDDKAKNRMLEELHEQLAAARGGLADQLLAPVFREVLMVVDRVTSLRATGDAVLASVVDELHEMLERHDVRRIPHATMFDPAMHEAVGTVADAGAVPGAIVSVVRPGYVIGDKLLRPERVIVSAAEASGESPAFRDSQDSASADARSDRP